jgi:hypothetical protein
LTDHNGHAQLADFDPPTIVSGPAYITVISSSYVSVGTFRCLSPEPITPDQFGCEESFPTKRRDCYVLEMMRYEALNGRIPIARPKGFVYVRRVIEGLHPERYQGEEGVWFADRSWKMEVCWTPPPRRGVE